LKLLDIKNLLKRLHICFFVDTSGFYGSYSVNIELTNRKKTPQFYSEDQTEQKIYNLV